MKYRRVIRDVLLALLALVIVIVILAGCLWWYFHPDFERTEGIVYTQRHGQDLTFDIELVEIV